MSCASVEHKKSDSAHFKDGKFVNSNPLEKRSFFSFLAMKMQTKFEKWPEWVDIKSGPRPSSLNEEQSIKVTLINHATVLIQSHGINILTDPIYSHRCSPVSWAGPKRHHKPAIKFEDLPKIDIVLISHDHYDHLDLPTIEKLVSRDDPFIFVGLGVGKRLADNKKVIEMDWWDKYEVSTSVNINFTEVRHFSGRTLTDRNTTLWGGFVIELGDKKIYFGGDSGYGGHYKKTFNKYGKMDISFLPIGAYAPQYFMQPVHMNPSEALQAHVDLQSNQSYGIHYGTFQLTAEKRDEPVKWLKKERANLAFGVLELGIPKVIK